MASPLERVRALLTLAAHAPRDPNGVISPAAENEARNAAVEAARLIQRYGFSVVEAGAAAPVVPLPVASIPLPWLTLFRAADPLQARPEALCDLLRWTPADLLAVGRDRKPLSAAKLRRLRDFCARQGLALPLDTEHPALPRLLALGPAKVVTRAVAAPASSIEDVVRRAASEVTLSHVVDFLKR